MSEKSKKDKNKLTHRIHVIFSESLYNEVVKISEFKGMNVSTLIRMWITENVQIEKAARKK